MKHKHSASIKHKLQIIILATASIVLVTSMLLLMLLDISTAKKESEVRISSLAKVIGANSKAAITFLDRQAATEVLTTLKTQKDIIKAQLIIPNGNVFSQYASSLQTQNENHQLRLFFNKSVIVTETIKMQGETIGTVLIEGDMNSAYKAILNNFMVGMGVFFISIVLAVIISNQMQKVISRPINNLLNTMQLVATHQDFSQRADYIGKCELGSLADGFNNMLDQIQKRDKELATYHENLELKIDERTHELAKKNNELTRISRSDWLTGLNNRLRLDELFEQEILRSIRYKTTFSVILLDVDKFKHINDHYGHNIGDSTLKELADILSTYVRKSDFVGRWGGDEFLIICPETQQSGVSELANLLRQRIAKHEFITIGNNSCSFGTSTYQPGDSIVTMINRADSALLDVKKAGRNQVKNG